MADARIHGARKNIIVSLGCQVITLLCGIVVPQLMIRAYGSEVYGATVSIAQFLSYITLLEGGLGGVARAALYKPLAEHDDDKTSAVMAEVRRFFRIVGCAFLVYVLLIACSFNTISQTEIFDWTATFLLVITISISTFSQYFIGISNMILLQAAQKQYITNLVNIAGVVANTAAVIILIALKCDIITVKLASSVVFALKPIALWLYVRKHYCLRSVPVTQTRHLTQKWSGIGQHIAYFLHSNTDVVILTCFVGLKPVAVYSVYHMVVANMQNIASSFVSGMEALFGDMFAKDERRQLQESFNVYETIISVAAIVLFSVTTVMLVPFVRIYAAGVTDANYEAPVFACLLTASALLYCLRMPYHSMIIAAGHFRQTQLAAYGEAAMNVLLSILLVHRYELSGVAFATLAATGFRMIYYAIYLSQNILHRSVGIFAKRTLLNVAIFLIILITGEQITKRFIMENYGVWIICSFVVTVMALVITVVANGLLFRRNFRAALAMWRNRG